MIKASIAGATGYTGLELIRLLVQHPKVKLQTLTADSHAGKHIAEVAPSLRGHVDCVLETLKPSLAAECDVLFLCLPHTASMETMPGLLEGDCRIIDLSADYRLHSADVYEQWYKTPHLNPELLEAAVYGLPELHRAAIAKARLVANPGCYPTGALLALAPLMRMDGVDLASLIIDSKSGVSGAGRKLSLTTHFCETNEGVSAYGLGSHRHTPEIEQELSALAGRTLRLSFSPHLMPMTRGLLTTAYAAVNPLPDLETLHAHYCEFYAGEPFVRVLPPGRFADSHAVSGSNLCDIGVQSDPRTGRVVVTSAIDNLLKGASSQAVQNMNLMMGWEETLGLAAPPLFP